MDNNIKSIAELLTLDFLIPSYQRGYRWDKEQIKDLLEDILEFSNLGGKENGEFYCLQPIIVKKDLESKKFRLIDGQQRLTTIYIILAYFHDVSIMIYQNDNKFTIEYETRADSQTFLEDIVNTVEKDTSNIDYYYMSQAFLIIEQWFNEHPSIKLDFFNTLTKNQIEPSSNKDIANNVRFIWYEISEQESEIEVFTRINSGKIPLTNAELIKALFLNSKNFLNGEESLKQIEISKEWDEMEYSLQNDEFWHFLTKSKNYSTRIDLIFKVFSNQALKDDYDTYRYFAKQKNIVDTWADNNESIKKVFLSLKHWFENRKLYHLIGFLISEDKETAQSVYHSFKAQTKSEFRTELYNKINKIINLSSLDYLEYGKNSTEIKQILLLFNIATILNNRESYIRFSFDKFNNENWSLEHIHAQHEKILSNIDNQKDWLTKTQKYISNCMDDKNKGTRKILSTRIKNLLKQNSIDEFEEIQNEIFNLFGMSDIHTVDNLALLSTTNNSSLSNNIFPIKRDIIIEMDKKGAFIPLCTKNVFLKYYSKDISKLYFWQEEDREEYMLEIRSVLENFLGDINE